MSGSEDARPRPLRAGHLGRHEFELLVASVKDYAILMLDPGGHVVSWNAGAERIKGYAAEEIIGRNYSAFYTAEDVAAGIPARHLAEAAEQGRLSYQGLRVRKDGSTFWADVVITALVEDGRLLGFGKVTRDLSEDRRIEAELLHRSLHDDLTGLGNRRLFLERLSTALAQRAERGDGVLVVRLDIDRFKTINDSFGHEGGDQVLITVGRRLAECVGPSDTVARISADELVLLVLTDRPVEPGSVATRIIATLDEPVTVNGEQVHLSAAVGVRGAEPSDEQPEALLADADAAMRKAKAVRHGHQSRYRVFDPSMRAELERRLELELALPGALARRELMLAYQPVVRLDTGHVTSFEALLRWQRPGKGSVPPDDFIPLAERTGLIRPVGTWVLREACRQAVEWRGLAAVGADQGGGLGVAINVSAHQLHHRGVVAVLEEMLTATGLDPGAVTLELTESQIMDDAPASVTMLTDLKHLGVSLSVDDFGTGYSSLSYLSRLPVDVVKIDRTFVAGLGTNRHDSAIVEATVRLAQTLDLAVVAEGVETADQVAELRHLGCDYAQGWHFGRPQPAASIDATAWGHPA